MIAAFNAVDLPLVHRPLGQDDSGLSEVTTAVATLATLGDMEVGVWEHSVGVSTDIEVEKVFVVLSGAGHVTCDEGGVINLAPGVVGLLPVGARTTWTITDPVRKVWITLA